jgi:hypothetical protein
VPSWLLKSAVQRAISLLPASSKWNEFFQTYVTRSLDLTPERFDARLEYCGRHLRNFLELQPENATGFSVFELGTGWYPVVPVGLFLCGAGKSWTVDIAPLLESKRVTAMLWKFVEYGASGALIKYLPRVIPRRLEILRGLAEKGGEPEQLLREMEIEFRVVDAQNTGLPASAIDLFTSTGVLEYIPRTVLRNILLEAKRVGKDRAVQSHYLNLVDQFSYFDNSITPFNFLKFSNRAWSYLNSPIIWQNRLRITDFRALFVEAGYRMVKEENTTGRAEDLAKVKLAPEFAGYRREDLLVILSWVVASHQ